MFGALGGQSPFMYLGAGFHPEIPVPGMFPRRLFLSRDRVRLFPNENELDSVGIGQSAGMFLKGITDDSLTPISR
jgi:hypothetical protein